jgi:hypothetical protein
MNATVSTPDTLTATTAPTDPEAPAAAPAAEPAGGAPLQLVRSDFAKPGLTCGAALTLRVGDGHVAAWRDAVHRAVQGELDARGEAFRAAAAALPQQAELDRLRAVALKFQQEADDLAAEAEWLKPTAVVSPLFPPWTAHHAISMMGAIPRRDNS